MSPECGTTTKNHNKVKQNETCKSKQKKMHIVWNEFIISYLHVYTCITYLQDWLSTMSWYLSFEHTAKPCLSNFRTWKFLVWPTSFYEEEKIWSRFSDYFTQTEEALRLWIKAPYPKARHGLELII